jgi:hypothetical protein
VADGGERVLLLWPLELDDDDGTCWKARVTSCNDIRDAAIEVDGGGVCPRASPSSDLTSCKVNGKAVRSSAMPSSEFTAGSLALSEAWDQTALRCSGSGARAGDSLIGKLNGALVHISFE